MYNYLQYDILVNFNIKGKCMVARGKQKDDPILAFIGMITLGVGLFTYYKTNSLSTAAIVSGGILGLCITIGIIINRIRIKKIKSSGIYEVDNMNGREFEIYLSHLFSSYGYDVQLTEATGDYGADLILINENEKIIIQAKRYNSNIGIKAVQEVHAAIAYYNGDEAWVVTNSYFTNAAFSLAKSNGVRLVDREQLIELMLEINSNVDINTEYVEEDELEEEFVNTLEMYDPNDCPRCGNMLVKRNGSRGEFLGCSSFPKCRHTEAIYN